jgi:hypothetical protein
LHHTQRHWVKQESIQLVFMLLLEHACHVHVIIAAGWRCTLVCSLLINHHTYSSQFDIIILIPFCVLPTHVVIGPELMSIHSSSHSCRMHNNCS